MERENIKIGMKVVYTGLNTCVLNNGETYTVKNNTIEFGDVWLAKGNDLVDVVFAEDIKPVNSKVRRLNRSLLQKLLDKLNNVWYSIIKEMRKYV